MGRAFGLKKGLTLRDYINEFSRRAKNVHGKKYSYSFSVYSFERKKVSIKCPVHGTFEQKPSEHLTGSGCKKCGDIERGKLCTRRQSLYHNWTI